MHVGLAGVPPRTEDLLDLLVVGGGIAGLATAWSLQTAGHRVTLFEQCAPDNMSKVSVVLLTRARTLSRFAVSRRRSLYSHHDPNTQRVGSWRQAL